MLSWLYKKVISNNDTIEKYLEENDCDSNDLQIVLTDYLNEGGRISLIANKKILTQHLLISFTEETCNLKKRFKLYPDCKKLKEHTLQEHVKHNTLQSTHKIVEHNTFVVYAKEFKDNEKRREKEYNEQKCDIFAYNDSECQWKPKNTKDKYYKSYGEIFLEDLRFETNDPLFTTDDLEIELQIPPSITLPENVIKFLSIFNIQKILNNNL